MDLTFTIDTTGLAKGIAAASLVTKRTMPELVNTSAYWIAVNAKGAMPFVTPEKIDSELGVIKQAVIGKRGKALKGKFNYRTRINPNLQSATGTSLAEMIVMARTNPSSNYNRLTGGRWALPSLKGMTKEGRKAAIAKLVDKMIKSRHSSTHFLIAGWMPAIIRLKEFAVQKMMRGASPNFGMRNYYGGPIGYGKPSSPNQDTGCFAEIANEIGTEGANSKAQNDALQKYGARGLQDAVDREGKANMEYGLKHMDKELAAAVNPHWS